MPYMSHTTSHNVKYIWHSFKEICKYGACAEVMSQSVNHSQESLSNNSVYGQD